MNCPSDHVETRFSGKHNRLRTVQADNVSMQRESRDPVMDVFYKRDASTGEIAPMTSADWQHGVHGLNLPIHVPVAVRELFGEAEGLLHCISSIAFATR